MFPTMELKTREEDSSDDTTLKLRDKGQAEVRQDDLIPVETHILRRYEIHPE